MEEDICPECYEEECDNETETEIDEEPEIKESFIEDKPKVKEIKNDGWWGRFFQSIRGRK